MSRSDRWLVLDISEHQRGFDYFKFKANNPQVLGVILRVGYTGWGRAKSKQKDDMFDEHYAGFRRVGLPIGVYWYSCAVTVEEAREEARLTLQYVKDKQLDYPIYFDTENDHNINAAGASQVSQAMLPRNTLTSIAIAYCEEIEKAGYYVGIYASASWFKDKLDLSRLTSYDKWVAHYGVSSPGVTFRYGMWQFTDKAMVDGYRGYVDLNWCTRDYPRIIKSAGLNGYTKPVIPEEPEINLIDRMQMHLKMANDNLEQLSQLMEELSNGSK